MATIQAADIADLVALTLDDLGRGRWTEIATDLQEHVAMQQLLRAERVGFQSGKGIQFNVMFQESGAAKNVGLYEVDNVNVADVMVQGDIPWRHTTTNYAIERREIAMNRDPARIVELLKIRRADAMISLAERMENNFWTTATDDSLSPFGIDYWLPAVSTSTEGFTLGNHTNFSSGPANIDSDTYTRWQAYEADYVNITKQDLVRKWRRAATFTKFMPPADPNPDYNTGNRYGYYCNYNVIGPLEEALEAQNDNLGNDIASKDGMLMFRRVPVVWVPFLEDDPIANNADDIYGINWGVTNVVFLAGEYMRTTGPQQAANQHTVTQVHVDLTYNFVMYDRRRCFKLSKAT